MHDTAHSFKDFGSREWLDMFSRRVLQLKRCRKWGEIYKCDPFQRQLLFAMCFQKGKRVKLQEGRESRCPVSNLDTILASCVSGSSLSHVRSHTCDRLHSFDDLLLMDLDQTTPAFQVNLSYGFPVLSV